MAKHETLGALFTSIADKIRGKLGTADKIVADDFPDKIGTIVTLEEGTADADATAADIAAPFAAYVKGVKVVGEYVKGKRCSVGTITVYDGSFSNNSKISTPALQFKPDGAVFIWVDTDGSVIDGNSRSVCAVATADYKQTLHSYHSGGYNSDPNIVVNDDVSVTFGDDYISIDDNDFPFPKGEKMFYVAWGD